MATPPNIELIYRKSRADLLPYEDARFSSLISSVANYYISRNDQTVFGDILRIFAEELAQIDYFYTYSLANKDPKYLTPPDIKRRWAGPLQVSGDYPASYQGDQDYKKMLQALLIAFRQGTTLQGITQVVQAYTNDSVQIEELYKLVGKGYDFSDRNSISVSVNTGDSVSSLNTLQNITADLYNAIAVAKPAHVGIDFSVIFSENENMENIINAITDDLRITFQFEENDTTVPFRLAPLTKGESVSELVAVGQVVGNVFAKLISTATYIALPYASFKAEYTGPDVNTDYSLLPTCYTDVALTTGPGISASAYANLTTPEKIAYTLASDGNYYPYTGQISKSQGILAPHINSVWEITGENLLGLDLD